MTANQEELSDEALAEKISEDGRLSGNSQEDEGGMLEAGVDLSTSTTGDANDPDFEEEPFSINDFEEVEIASAEDMSSPISEINDQTSNVEFNQEEQTANVTPPADRQSELGEVAEFRNTLSALSKQLEIDRLTFLYKQMQEKGKPLPNLGKIASDIRGESKFQPYGDEDLYSKRPFARLQGWIAGLSFGVGRRAKKFPR